MIPGMGKDAPARLAPQAESEKVEKSPVQDKTAEPAEKATKRRGCPQGGKAEKGPEPRKSCPAKVDKAALDESPSPRRGEFPNKHFCRLSPRKNSKYVQTCPACRFVFYAL